MSTVSLYARAALAIVREAARLILRHPMVGILAVPIDPDGRIVLMRRRDTGTWSLPGGMLEWGESLESALGRELREETGCELDVVARVIGVYSDPARDPRMHSVAVVVEARVVTAPPAGAALNPLESLEARAFAVAALPPDLAYDTRRILDDWRAGAPTRLA